MVVLKTFWRCTLHSLGKESQLLLQCTSNESVSQSEKLQSTKKNVGQIVNLIKAGPRDVLGWNRERILTIHVSINLCTGSQACIISWMLSWLSLLFFLHFFKKNSSGENSGPAENYWVQDLCLSCILIFFFQKSGK